MKIPEIQAALIAIAGEMRGKKGAPNDLRADRIVALTLQLSRRKSPGRKPNPVSTPMTDALRARIRQTKAKKPSLTQLQIAQMFNVSPGRVSETLSGYRN